MELTINQELLSDKLNENEINELKKINVNENYYTRKYYNLFINNIIFILDEKSECKSNDYFCLGCYYQFIEKKYEQMKIFYLKAIENGNSSAMNNLGCYYQDIEINYEQMKIFYLKAIEKGNIDAMVNLGYYYQNIEKNYEQMKIFYLKAIEKGSIDAMNELGEYYEDIEKNYEQMKIFYLKAIENGSIDAMFNLGWWYENIEINYEQMKFFYLKAIENGNSNAIFHLGYYYQFIEENYEQMKFFYLKAISLGNYDAMNGLGLYYESIEQNYNLAKETYLLLLNSKIDIKIFYNVFCNSIIKNIFITRLIINHISELFTDKFLDLEKVESFVMCIAKYFKIEYNYEKIPENINIYFLYIGKILKKCNKGEKRKIIDSKIIDLKEIREIIDNFINKTTTNKNISKLIIKKYFKEIYEGYKEI
jgi:TPR repeat protein